MNEPFDSLEAELQSLRPLDLSPQTKQRITNELSVAPPVPADSPRRFVDWSAPIAALVAACLLVALALRPAASVKSPDVHVTPEQISLSAAFDDALPSVWTYRRALIHSPLAAEDLLDKHAALAPRGPISFTPVFVRSPSALQLHGEL